MPKNSILNKVRPFYRWLQPIYAPVFNWSRRNIRFLVKLYKGRKLIREEIEAVKAAQQELKVVVGACTTHYTGWIHTDFPYLDMTNAGDWKRFFQYNTIHRILIEHVIEHITEKEFHTFLTIVKPYLTEQGSIRIAVPDGYHPDPDYIEFVRPGGYGPGCDDHKILYTADSLTAELERAGFDYRLLEYYDIDGKFHQEEWDESNGPIVRAAGFVAPANPSLAYSSLLLDCWLRRSN